MCIMYVLIVVVFSAQIWDLRNMRSPLDSVRVDCGINRYCHPSGTHRVPLARINKWIVVTAFIFLSYVLSIISHVYDTVQVYNGFSADTKCFTHPT